MGNNQTLPHTDWEPDSETWKQILSRDEYQIPDTTKEILRDHCGNIERMYQIELTGISFTEEKGQRREKLFKDYKDLGQRVVNEAGKVDWNGVEKNLEGITNEMQEIANGAIQKWLDGAAHRKMVEALFEQIICVEDIFGNKVKVEGVKRSDPVEKLLDKIEIKTKVPKHEIVLTCNGERLERNHRLTDYGGNVLSSIIMLREKQQEQDRAVDMLNADSSLSGSSSLYFRGKVGATFRSCLAIMNMVIATLFMALDLQQLDPVSQIIWKVFKGVLESSKVALDLANDMLSRLGVQTIGTFYKDILESLKVVWDEAKNVLKSLEKLIPCFFAEFKRAVTEMELVKISQQIGNNWEMLGRTLGIDEVKLQHIKADNPTMARQILKMLTTWREDIESEATVGMLYTAMKGCQSLSFNKKQIELILSGAPLDI